LNFKLFEIFKIKMESLKSIPSQLEGFNIKQLRKIAKTYSVFDISNKNKKELIKAIVDRMYILMH
jgi:hypothetical protein